MSSKIFRKYSNILCIACYHILSFQVVCWLVGQNGLNTLHHTLLHHVSIQSVESLNSMKSYNRELVMTGGRMIQQPLLPICGLSIQSMSNNLTFNILCCYRAALVPLHRLGLSQCISRVWCDYGETLFVVNKSKLINHTLLENNRKLYAQTSTNCRIANVENKSDAIFAVCWATSF